MRQQSDFGKRHVLNTRRGLGQGAVSLAAVAVVVGMMVGQSSAASLTWDGGDAAVGGTTGGNGTWDSGTTSNWTNATPAEQAWTDTTGTDTATFGGTAGTVNIASGGVTANKLQFNTTAYTLSGSGTITLAGSSPTIAVGSLASTTISAPISVSNLTITAVTNGFLALNGNNSSITGTTTLNLAGGAIGLTAPGTVSTATNNGLGNSAIKFTSNGQVNYRNNGDNANTVQNLNYGNNVELNGGNGIFNVGRLTGNTTSDNKTFAFGTLTFTTANSFTLAGAIGSNPSDRISFSGVSLAANGNVAFTALNGVASLGAIGETVSGRSFTVSTGAGVTGTTLVLTGAASYTGATNIQVGTVREGISDALATGSVLTLGIASGTAVLDLNGFSQKVSGLATAGTAASQSITNSATGASVLTFNTGTSNFGGILKDSGTGKTLALTISGGALTLTGANTYIGGTNLNGGVLNVGVAENAGVTGPLGKSGNITFGGGTLQYSAANGFDYASRIKSSSSAIAIDTNNVAVSLSALDSTNTGGLTKSGANTLTLTGTNAYTGQTTVTNGTLALANAASIATSTVINLNGGSFDTSAKTAFALGSGQTLKGQGTMAGGSTSTTLNGILSVGQTNAAAGTASTLTINNGLVVLNNAAQFDLFGYTAGVANTSADKLITNNIQYGGGPLVVSNETGTPSTLFVSGSKWDLFDGTYTSGAFNNTFANNDANLPSLAAGLGWNFNYSTGELSVVTVPEPAVMGMMAVGIGLLIRRRKHV